MALVTPWLMAEPDRFALMHGDYRLDNLLFDPDRTHVTVVDWQTLGIGLPASDLAYFTATSLLPRSVARLDERTSSPRTTRALLGYGITGYDRDTCWHDYRLGMLQAPLLTALGFAFASIHRARRRDDAGHVAARLPGHPRPRQLELRLTAI